MKLFTDPYTGETNRFHARIERTDRTRELVDYDVRDAKGRAVGGMIVRWTKTYREDDDSHTLVWVELHDQTRYCVKLYSTRDGKTFGAIPRTTYHETETLREAHVAKAVARARRRALNVHA